MVFEGFDKDVRKDSVISRRIKRLTKKTKSSNKDYLTRRNSLIPAPLQPLMNELDKDQKDLEDQHNADIDAFLL